MVVFHGSDNIVKKPIYGYGKESNDYGSGFYLTEDREKANAWAVVNGVFSSAYCNEYELPTDDLSILDLDDCGVLAWIAEVLAHRGEKEERLAYEKDKLIEMYKEDTDDYDVIVGYRADDSYMQVITSFLSGELNENDVFRLFHEGELGKQVCLKSKKAFDTIKFVRAEKITDEEPYLNYDVNARKKAISFLNNRRQAIKRDGFRPQGITINEAIRTHYTYDKTYGFYMMDAPESTPAKSQNAESVKKKGPRL